MAELTYPLPAETVSALRTGLKGCRNPGLVFDRFSPDIGALDSRDAGEGKRRALDRVRGCVPDQRLLDAFRARWLATASSLGATTFQARTASRMVVGLGRKGPLEVGFTFHRLYGFPLIPGSALKGLARAAALLEKGGNERDEDLVVVFGRQPDRRDGRDSGCGGHAVFLDAIPAGPLALELDIMNPHYPDYYGDQRIPPTDWQNPNPVYFLAVAPGTPFLFAVGWRGDADEAARMRAVGWLRAGLTDLGVGAKTTAGYGYFVVGDAVPSPAEAAQHQAAAGRGAEVKGEGRRGRVRVFHSDKGWGIIVEDETGDELRFEAAVREERGWTPGGKAAVEYLVVDRGGEPVVTRVRQVK